VQYLSEQSGHPAWNSIASGVQKSWGRRGKRVGGDEEEPRYSVDIGQLESKGPSPD
jgi:hypothetical protein